MEWEAAPSDLGSVDELPLPPAVAEVLASLQPPRPASPHLSKRGGGRRIRPLLEGREVVRECAEALLGDRLPAIDLSHWHSADVGQRRELWSGVHSATASPSWFAARGRPTVKLLLAPAAVDLERLSGSGVVASGGTLVTWRAVREFSEPVPETARRRERGDSTVVRIRHVLVLVNFSDRAGTTLTWHDRAEPEWGIRRVRIEAPFSPVSAVERLVADGRVLSWR